MPYQTIQSESNPKFKRWKKMAQSARAIRSERATLAEGAHLAQTALERDIKVQAVLLRAKGLNNEAAALLEKFLQKGVQAFVLDSLLFDAISPVEHGAGLMIEISLPTVQRPRAMPTDVLYLDGIQDPGNIGTLIRTAVASGVHSIASSPECAHFWSPKALRAGMGAHFAAALYENVKPQELRELFDARILAADARGGSDLYLSEGWEAGHTVWMMGSEGQGLSLAALAVTDERLYIPIDHDCESLNVSAAAAVCLFEQRRRRLTQKR